MNEEAIHDEETLRQELRQAREKLDRLVADLRAVDGELESLETERKQYRLLQDVCLALDELDQTGGAPLFWSAIDPDGGGASHLRMVRSRIEEFEKRLDEVEERRQGILDEIQLQEDEADFIAGDILEAERLEEQRRLEWEIDREPKVLLIRTSQMPWTRGGEDDRRFWRTLACTLLASIVLGLLLPWIEIPVPERWEVLEEQNRLTQLIRDELPPPAVVAPEPEPLRPDEPSETETTEEPALAEESRPESEAAPAATSQDTPSKGILAFREKFSGLATSRAADRLGSNARIQDPGDVAPGLPQRSMVTTEAPGSSGGINVAELSRDTGGSGREMNGVEVTQATSTIGTGGGSDRPLAGGGPGPSRTDEEIQIVFDRHKAALYRLYNRELRKNPTLKGQMVLRLTIEPDGTVSFCEVKSTDMKAPNLASRVVDRVKTFDFGAKEVPAVTIVYPIDFLPAT